MRMTFRVTRFALREEVAGPVEKRRHESHRDVSLVRTGCRDDLFESHRDGILDSSRRMAGFFESHMDGISDRSGYRDELIESQRDGNSDGIRRKAGFFESHRDDSLDRSRRTAGFFESQRDGNSYRPLHSRYTISKDTLKRNPGSRFLSKLASRWDSQGVFYHDHLSKLPSRWDSNCLQCNYSDAGFPLAIPAEAETSPVIPAEAEIRSIINHPYIHFRAYLFPPVRAPHTLTGTALINPQMYTYFGASESVTTRNRHA